VARGFADAALAAFLCLALLSSPAAALSPATPLFADATAGSGIPPLKFAEGVNACDLTGDGLPDLFLPNARGRNRLFVNLGGLQFGEATDHLGPPTSNGVGAVVAELTADTAPEIFVVRGNYSGGTNLLYVGGETGRFSEVAAAAGISTAVNGIAAAAADVDLDGRLDLLVSTWSGATLYRNVSTPGRPSFEDVTAEAGIAGGGRGWGAVFADFTGDHLPDLFLARGTKGKADPCRFYVNEGGGRFSDATAASGIVGIRWGTGGVPTDLDGDGDLDLFVTDLEGKDRIFRNDGTGTFTDVTMASGVTSGKSHGAVAGDIDGDLRPDLVVGGFGEPLRAYRNLGGMRFEEVTQQWGLEGTTRNLGVVLADLDRDGDLDLYVANADGKNRLYRNQLENNRNPWIVVTLAHLPLGGIGAEVRLKTADGKGTLLARTDCLGGFGYCSQGPAEALFSLPAATCEVEITLPGGRTLTIPGVRPGVIDATFPVEATTP
jgi:hypothetical protein